jgi:pimeloyl-ACP methyl ester carboxylesterase
VVYSAASADWVRALKNVRRFVLAHFANRIAGARVELIDKAGHLPHLEHPDVVASAVRGFLAG